MKTIVTAIKIVLISILAIFYYPVIKFFVWFQKYYRIWKREDPVSYAIATPLYWLAFLVTTIIAIPFENLAGGMHPPLDKFR